MWDILILNVGSDKNDFYKDGFIEYSKRLSPYIKLRVEEIKSLPFKSQSDKVKVKKSETEKVLNILNKYLEAEKVLLMEDGKEYDSIQFSKFLDLNKNRKIIFVIFGSLGPDREMIDNFKKLSLSRLTFTHGLSKLVLLEQIFRSICLIKNKDYHY